MKNKYILAIGALVVVAGLFLSSVVLANVGNNDKNGFQVNGNHYNLNIIGKDKHADVGDSSGHTMFVLENGKTRIYMTQDDLGVFDVVDRNGLDGRAEFNIAPGHYNIYATALGKPGGKVKIDAWGNFTDAVEGTQLILLGYVDISREKGKPQSVNINELFYVDVTLCTAAEIDPDTGKLVCTEWTTYEDYWVFDIDELIEYYWEYNNDGIKLLQVRFYGCTLATPEEIESGDYPKDYCRWEDGTPIDSKKTVIAA